MRYTYRAKEVAAVSASSAEPNTNISSHTDCIVQCSNDWCYRAFIRHDLQWLSKSARIISAKLYLYCDSHGDNAAGSKHKFARVLEDWDEATLCWNNMPAVSSEAFPDEWLDLPQLNTWTAFDVTEVVQGWVSQEHPNYGLQIVNGTETGYRKQWYFANRKKGKDVATYIEVEIEGEESDYYKTSKEWLTAIADQARRLGNATGELPLEQIKHIFSGVSTAKPSDKWEYNGVLLPKIASELLEIYPYAWIRNDSLNKRCDLMLGKKPFYYNSKVCCSDTTGSPYYYIPHADADADGKWILIEVAVPGQYSLDTNRTVLWSNHDIPNGSASATEIYFKGSEPVIP